jgi:hypothetical protein
MLALAPIDKELSRQTNIRDVPDSSTAMIVIITIFVVPSILLTVRLSFYERINL